MKEQIYQTPRGNIHYWINDCPIDKSCTLLFLPGLTSDHRLFDKQLEYFEHRYNVSVWDAPGHAASWPFQLDFILIDKAGWLQEIIEFEYMEKPIIIRQSIGGYVGQAYMERLPSKLSGFISIDSALRRNEWLFTALCEMSAGLFSI